MHPIQEKLLKVIDGKNVGDLTLRQIGELIEEKLPQKVKHHLSQLERKGFILIDRKNKNISRISNKAKVGDIFISIPIIGAANCGPATIYADQNIEGYLKISKRLVSNKKSVFALRAEGNSLNMANIKKYLLDKKNSRIALLSESTQEYSPIFIHENDDFKISGKIVDVVKNIKQ